MLNSSILVIALILPLSSTSHAQAISTAHADEAVPSTTGHSAGASQTPSPPTAPSEPERPSWGVIDATGSGVVVHRSEKAELAVGAYALVRYINQLPGEQQFTDHLGNVHDIDTRNDIQFHRAMIHFRGWLLSPKAR